METSLELYKTGISRYVGFDQSFGSWGPQQSHLFVYVYPSILSYLLLTQNQFSVEQRRRVGILQKPLAIPPREEVYLKRWIYGPCPLDGDPPIADRLFLHYLSCSQRSNVLFWMPRMPRKLNKSIFSDGIASAVFGWGVHIEEGPNYHAIFWMNFLCLVTSGIFAALWTMYKHDFQGAFGFACWFIAIINTFMIALMYRWKLWLIPTVVFSSNIN